MKQLLTACLLGTTLSLGASVSHGSHSAADLQAEQAKLGDMRQRFKEKHPAVQKQIARIQALEKQQTADKHGNCGELRAAKAKLAEMRQRFKEKHPAVLKQVQLIERLEKQHSQE